MSIEPSDVSCPECGQSMQVMYVTERKQVVSGYACPDCGFATSEKNGEQNVTLSDSKEYLLRIERPLSTDEFGDSTDVQAAFRARARDEITDDEVWLLIDPDEDEVVDFVAENSF